ncbi:hypothetical protein M3592_03100 [Priestia aryabhattai]|uniref:hypothetical protein n=1 Tax=Priestia aryabhattai TaxID=412384 RepID=UPI00203F3E71|nr:hypothetical protein [Priestia aryabhattai]MCM2974420.1 hypothetical protein [Priestia aryabhattai]
MNQLDKLPKNIKKTVRYINQNISYEQLLLFKKILVETIEKKEKEFYKRETK